VVSSSSLDHATSFPSNINDVPSMRAPHQRSSSDFLAPPTVNRIPRPHSRGHRFTISEGGSGTFLTPHVSPESSMYLGDDLRGRGLARANTAPSSKAISRRRSPYDRPASQAAVDTSLVIPDFVRPISGQSSPEVESPSPGSATKVVATDAMIQASARRRKRDANYFCSQCPGSFTTENSRKRHERSHGGEKAYTCNVPGCGQTFFNDDDRKRHENKSKKHAR
jgi:hypothetical protein